MALIKWNNSLNVNISEIDKQHQGLVEVINELHDAMRQRKARDVLGKIIDRLMVYAEAHFITEEKYFDMFNYPDAKNHKNEHLDFVNKIYKFKDEFLKDKIGLSVEVIDFLTDWLQHHIKCVDKKYGPFFNEKGLK